MRTTCLLISQLICILLLPLATSTHAHATDNSDIQAANPNSQEQTTQEALTVVVGIRPLKLLLDEAFSDLIKVSYLVPPQQSPHTYRLRPSDVARIRSADLIITVSPLFDAYLMNAVQNFDKDHLNLREAIQAAPDLALLGPEDSSDRLNDALPSTHDVRKAPGVKNTRQSHTNNEHHEGHQLYTKHEQKERGGAQSPHHHLGGENLHFWMGRAFAMEIIQATGRRLAVLYPELAEEMLQVAKVASANLTASVSNASAEISRTATRKSRKLISYHRAFDYLAADLGLHFDEVVAPVTEVKPGARTINHLYQLSKANDICLILEPQFSAKKVRRLLSGEQHRIVTLDPMGANQSTYTAYYNDLATKLKDCATGQ